MDFETFQPLTNHDLTALTTTTVMPAIRRRNAIITTLILVLVAELNLDLEEQEQRRRQELAYYPRVRRYQPYGLIDNWSLDAYSDQ